MTWLMIGGALLGAWTLLNVLSGERESCVREMQQREALRLVQEQKQREQAKRIPTAIELSS